MPSEFGQRCVCGLWLALTPMLAVSAEPEMLAPDPQETLPIMEMPTGQVSGSFEPGADFLIDIVAISVHVEEVEGRLREGRYARLDVDDQNWIRGQISALRRALPEALNSPEAALAVHRSAMEFGSRMALLEQGGIVCRHERRTGSSLMSRRCLTRKVLEQQTIAEQERWRRMTRPGTGTSKSMPLTGLR